MTVHLCIVRRWALAVKWPGSAEGLAIFGSNMSESWAPTEWVSHEDAKAVPAAVPPAQGSHNDRRSGRTTERAGHLRKRRSRLHLQWMPCWYSSNFKTLHLILQAFECNIINLALKNPPPPSHFPLYIPTQSGQHRYHCEECTESFDLCSKCYSGTGDGSSVADDHTATCGPEHTFSQETRWAQIKNVYCNHRPFRTQ